MPLPDDPDVKAADDRLTAAVQQALDARGFVTGVTTDVLVLVAQQSFDEFGQHGTSITRLVPGETTPHYRLLGMLDVATVRLRRDYLTDGDDDD